MLSPAALLRGALTAVGGAGRKGPPQGVRQQPFPTALQWLRAASARAGREHEVVGAEGFAGMDGFAARPPAFCPNESDMSLSGESQRGWSCIHKCRDVPKGHWQHLGDQVG